MKIFIDADKALEGALKRALFMVIAPNEESCDNPAEADLIIVESKAKLMEHFDERKFFAVLSIEEAESQGLPSNARYIPPLEFIPPMVAFIEKARKDLAARSPEPEAIKTGVAHKPKKATAKSLNVLVVDDTPDNLRSALTLLGQIHTVTLAANYGEALDLVRKNRYNAVLSDCQMPVQIKGTALSTDAVTIGEKVPNGIFLVFHATKRGARVAIVTDGNHHQDWVSALFDDNDLRKCQEVNGQSVLFINYMDKDWDRALKNLMIPNK